jgi:hypothetical protein
MGSKNYMNDLKRLVENDSLEIKYIDKAIKNLLLTKMYAGLVESEPIYNNSDLNSSENSNIAYEAAIKSIILLKNENKILPLNNDKIKSIALIGPSANVAQLDGYGSSYVIPLRVATPKEGIERIAGYWKINYSKGCDINSTDTSLFSNAISIAEKSDFVIFVGGLDLTQEGEMIDRVGNSCELPLNQQLLISRLSEKNPNIIVVMKSGGIVCLSKCIDKIKGLIYAFYPGQEGGYAIADVIFGLENPGGKLPVTMPKNDSQLPIWDNDFRNDNGSGYFWFNKNSLFPQFPFGFGLSYSDISLKDVKIRNSDISKGEDIIVDFKLTNNSNIPASEIIQVYLKNFNGFSKKLIAFDRVYLNMLETKTSSLKISGFDYMVWDTTQKKYVYNNDLLKLSIGNSSQNLIFNDSIKFNNRIVPDLIINKVFSYPKIPNMNNKVYFSALVGNYGNADLLNKKVHLEFLQDGEVISYCDTILDRFEVGTVRLIHADISKELKKSYKESIEIMTKVSIESEEIDINNNLYSYQIKINSNNNNYRNIAYKKPIIVSDYLFADLRPEYLNDGLLNSRWSSKFEDNKSIEIDLENYFNISRIELRWELAFAKSYNLLLSKDRIIWDTIVSIDFATGNNDEYFTNHYARYIKLECLKRATPWGFSLFEIIANGKEYQYSDLYFKDEVGFSISPNPASDYIEINLDSPSIKRGQGGVSLPIIEIYNIFGELQDAPPQTPPLEGRGLKIDVSNLPAGVYFIKIGDKFEKFVKM